MFKKFSHILSENKKCERPRNFIFVDTETISEDAGIKNNEILERAVLKLGWACYTEIREINGKEIIKDEWVEFKKPEEFWNFVNSVSRAKKKIYIYAHNWNFDFFSLNSIDNIARLGWELKSKCVENGIFILKFQKENTSYVITDTGNYIKDKLENIGKEYGIEKLKIDFNKTDEKSLSIYCRRDVEIIRKFIIEYRKFIFENDLGNFKLTLASQAFSGFRHRFMKHKIFIHSNEKVTVLERESYHGGRSEAFFIGKLPNEPLFMLDVNSMYPKILHDEELPIKLEKYYKSCSVQYLNFTINSERNSVIAECEIETKENVFPKIQNKKLIFPIGKFKTVLTTPEIKYALENKLIKKVYRIAIYRNAVIAKDYIDFFYEMKKKAKTLNETDLVKYNMSKRFMNLLYGKFGQMSTEEKITGKCEENDFKSESCINLETGKRTNRLYLSGKIYEKTGEKLESFDSFPAIASHVTAGARMRLWNFMKIAGLNNVLYCDTDSLLLFQEGYFNLLKNNMIDKTELGKLSLEMTGLGGEIRGVKDYKIIPFLNFIGEEKIRIKGIRKDAVKLSENSYRQTKFFKFAGLAHEENKNGALISKVKKTLKRNYDKGLVTESGKVVPFVLNEF